MASETLGYRVAITRVYGGITVNLELSSLTGGDTPSERDAEFDRLMAELLRQHERLSDKAAIKAAKSASSAATATNTTSFKLASVERVYHDNKPCAKLKGGEFVKFGVMCYPETWHSSAFAAWLEKNPDDDLSQWTVIVELKQDGKPKRVLDVQHA